ncbi:MAG: HAMP domain-containing sensor histidine kinase [Oscillospiraceae bacterium]|nr:HAMP domain-containing sensor histidine kinase [Oscillospiraceae bacterium]
MAMRRITRRWLYNSFGVILLILIAFEVVFSFGIRSYYYSSVRQTMSAQADYVESLFKKYSQDASADYRSEVRGVVENFSNKDKMELMALDSKGGVVITSSGFDVTETLYMPDFDQAMEQGSGYFQGIINDENVMAITALSEIPDEEFFAIRFVTSLTEIDRQIISLIVLITLIGVAIIFFVVMSSSYFINSIVVPLGQVGQTAQKIARGNFDVRLEKKNDDEIGDLCDVINHMAGELSTTEKLKNDFISSVSHELRTPLTAIKGWAETLSACGPGDGETLEKGMGVIIKETERLSSMVEELLDFSRMQSGRLQLTMDKMDLLAELGDAVLMFTERARRESVSIVYEEPEDLIPVLGDKNRLRQVFINILDNALKYSHAQGVISVTAARRGEAAVVVIADNGDGIRPEDLPKIKTKFYKGNTTRRGSGIGLAVAEEICTMHGGRLDIDSVFGEGTTVTIELPLATKKTEEALLKKSLPEGAPDKKEDLNHE